MLGSGHFVAAGGKGANQAVAAARLGQPVAMVGRVGDDDAGRTLLAGLNADGIDTSGVQIDREAGTGIALITLDDDAENAIVVSPGANGNGSRPQTLTPPPTGCATPRCCWSSSRFRWRQSPVRWSSPGERSF